MANCLRAIQTTALAVRKDLATGESIARFDHRQLKMEATRGQAGVWLAVRRESGAGVALQLAPSWGMPLAIEEIAAEGSSLRVTVVSAAARFKIQVSAPDLLRDMVRAEVTFIPERDLIVSHWPRDLYPINAESDPAETCGRIWAGQRGFCSGLIYLTLDEPAGGNVLYFQNYTRLNDYFLATGTEPDSAVGGEWPELGLLLPTAKDGCVKQGHEYVVSDAFLAFNSDEACEAVNPKACSRTFLDLLAGIYTCLPRTRTRYHDWPWRAKKTLRDLRRSPYLTTECYGNLYVRPYIDAEYPDSMVQLSVLNPVREYERWLDRPVSLADKLETGLDRFYDEQWQTIRRYLPNVGKDKDPDEVDAWYLYHPLSNLGRLALRGDEQAKTLFFRSIGFGIKVAHHFNYRWPVQYKLSTLRVIKARRKPTEPGQSDVGGIYAYVMMQAYELSHDAKYLAEARTALRATLSYRFDLLYQSNLTSWGIAACARLWEATGDTRHLDESFVFLANLFHNSAIWESQLGHAKHYATFFGVACLHDGPYMAIYECYETFCALTEYLLRAYDALPDHIRMLVAEHIKHGPNRAWAFYPDTLPAEALAKQVRNGRLDRRLSIPVEDLYVNGEPPGSVGQEVYGCGAAFEFTTHSYHRVRSRFFLYCEYPIRDLTESGERLAFEVLGGQGISCRARLIPATSKARSGKWRLHGVPAEVTKEGHLEFAVTAGAVELRLESCAPDDSGA